MARPIKTGLDYFPFYVDFFNDINIKKLIRYHTSNALPVYLSLLAEIYKKGYYLKWDNDLPFIISDQIKCDESFVQDVIKYCIEIALFSEKLYEENQILTSKQIQDTYAKICNLAKRVSAIDLYNLIKTPVTSEETPVTSEETPVTSEETPVTSAKSTQRKGKESIENEIKENSKKLEREAEVFPVGIDPVLKPPETESGFWVMVNKKKIFDLKKFVETNFTSICAVLKMKLTAEKFELRFKEFEGRIIEKSYFDEGTFRDHFNNFMLKTVPEPEKEKSSAKKEIYSYGKQQKLRPTSSPVAQGGYGKL